MVCACRYELLTGAPVFARFMPRSAILDQLSGRAPFPWEDPARAADLDRMKGLKRSVLRCLSRDPRRRPTSDQLIQRCGAVPSPLRCAQCAARAALAPGSTRHSVSRRQL